MTVTIRYNVTGTNFKKTLPMVAQKCHLDLFHFPSSTADKWEHAGVYDIIVNTQNLGTDFCIMVIVSE